MQTVAVSGSYECKVGENIPSTTTGELKEGDVKSLRQRWTTGVLDKTDPWPEYIYGYNLAYTGKNAA